ncbi:bifunctional adenosylcobinamide kinase/adenosylcobinamide-phosphate guanylyltransferase [Leptolyngbya sp. AN02str]|uniref:bifunctional adenosylcobinamide kinase/adenosylcobinamide-phosphate guanylyltransferase n=1 Tax=Leptolyngbya sp. AN02str TaxID=3423363 RepID=UPI003D31F4A7
MALTLVTGPARSGKSEWAELLASQSQKAVTYVATAVLNAEDDEWRSRIEQHRDRRPATWHTQEVPIALTDLIHTSSDQDCLLIDSLGTWLANLLEQDEADWEATMGELLKAVEQTSAEVIVVAEETGWGVVPAYPVGRQFRDRLGSITRHLGAIATVVYLVTGGHVLNLSRLGTPLPQHPGREI